MTDHDAARVYEVTETGRVDSSAEGSWRGTRSVDAGLGHHADTRRVVDRAPLKNYLNRVAPRVPQSATGSRSVRSSGSASQSPWGCAIVKVCS